MNFKKNDFINVTIEDIGSEGMGIAKAEGYALFIKGAIPKDECRVKITKVGKRFGYAKIEEIIKASPYRVKPICENAERCGGCQIMAMDYNAQLKFKEKKVRDNLERIGGVDFTKTEFYPIIGMDEPYRYRNKTQYPVGMSRDGDIVYGFYAGRTHVIISSDDCFLAPEINNRIMHIIKDFMEDYNIKPYDEKSGKGLIRHVLIRNTKDDDSKIMVCLIINGKKLAYAEELVERLKVIGGINSISLNINTRRDNVILGDKIINLYGDEYIIDNIEDLKYRISPKSFFQVNGIQTEKLYKTALEYGDIKEDSVVWDMYCGIGTISLFLARKAKSVYGVEIVPEAIDDARENSRINNMDNTEFFVGAAEDVVPRLFNENPAKYGNADVVVVDPPRKGCDEKLLETIVNMNPKRIVYVSCDSATLARDVKILSERGYDIEKVQPVDMFPHTGHVESCVLLERVSNRKADSYVKLNVKMEDYYRIKDEEKKTDE